MSDDRLDAMRDWANLARAQHLRVEKLQDEVDQLRENEVRLAELDYQCAGYKAALDLIARTPCSGNKPRPNCPSCIARSALDGESQ